MDMKFLKNKKYLAVAGVAVVIIVSVVLVVVFVFMRSDESNEQSVASSAADAINETVSNVSQEVQEYAMACGGMQDFFVTLFSRADLTYGEAIAELEPVVQSYATTLPPDSLAEIHNALADQHITILNLFQQEDGSGVISVEDDWVSVFEEYTDTWRPEAKVLYDSLPEDIQQALYDSGCIE